MVTDGIRYPASLPNPQRLANGDVVTYTGAVLPFAASCPPGTSPSPGTLRCEPYEGARNINYECGGALVPPTAPGCSGPIPPFVLLNQFTAPPSEMIDARPAWLRCNEWVEQRGEACGCSGGGGHDSHELNPRAALVILGGAVLLGLLVKGRRK